MPESCVVHPQKSEGAGNAGCSAAPAALCANAKSTQANSPQVQPKHRHSLRNGFNGLCRALPGVRDLVSHRRLAKRLARLSTSPGVPGPHAFAVRARAVRPVALARPSQPAARFVTMRIRPSCRGGMMGDNHIILKSVNEYFSIKQNFFLDADGKSVAAECGAGFFPLSWLSRVWPSARSGSSAKSRVLPRSCRRRCRQTVACSDNVRRCREACREYLRPSPLRPRP